MANPYWVRPVCDSMLYRVGGWLQSWPLGEVKATRKYLHKDGHVEHVPVQRGVNVFWHPKEYEYMLKILAEVKPEWDFGEELKNFGVRGLKTGKLLPEGRYACVMASYLSDVQALFETLMAVRDGKLVGKKLDQAISSGDFWSKT